MAIKQGGQYFYSVADHLGTPQKLINKDSAVGWAANYQSYGLAAPTTELITNPLRFPGQYEDLESGLYQNFHRDYDPRVGAYGTQDPVGVFQTGANRYGYVYGNPVGIMDVTGQDAQLCIRRVRVPLPYARHCFLKFNKDNMDTLSYDSEGVHADPKPSSGMCYATQGIQNDDCIRVAMRRCKAEEDNFTGFNCCHCVEEAMKVCGLSVPLNSWPNWPINPGQQPNEREVTSK